MIAEAEARNKAVSNLHEAMCDTVAYSDLRIRAGRVWNEASEYSMKDGQISTKFQPIFTWADI